MGVIVEVGGVLEFILNLFLLVVMGVLICSCSNCCFCVKECVINGVFVMFSLMCFVLFIFMVVVNFVLCFNFFGVVVKVGWFDVRYGGLKVLILSLVGKYFVRV